MFQRMIDDVRESTSTALQLTSLAVTIAAAGFVTLSFLCAAAFVAVLEAYGPVQACLTDAGIFFAVGLVAAAGFLIRRRQSRARAPERTKSAVQAALSDPMVVAIGLQAIRAVGIKRLVPLLAVGGIVLGLLAGRHAGANETPAE